MGLKDIVGKAQELSVTAATEGRSGLREVMGKAQELTVAATDAAGRLLDEFNEALPTMKSLGFTIKDLHMTAGIVPEIGAKLVASTDTLEPDAIGELIEKHPDNRTLQTALKALLAAYNISRQIDDFPLKGIELDVKLGIPPHVGVAFVPNEPAETPAAISSTVSPTLALGAAS